MFVDIHTHHSKQANSHFIRNVHYHNDFTFEKGILYSVGIHPWSVEHCNRDAIQGLMKLGAHPQVVVIGECGLDKYSNNSYEIQNYRFEEQIGISELHQKPLIIHCVGYYNELIAIKKEINPTQEWIIHGFRGKPQLAQQLLDAGMALSYGAYFNTESLRITPMDKLFIETDECTTPIEQLYELIATHKSCSALELTAGSQFWHKHCVL
jgi:TatD DNase family protein